MTGGEIALEGLAVGAAAYYAGRGSKFSRQAQELFAKADVKLEYMKAHPERYQWRRGGALRLGNWFRTMREGWDLGSVTALSEEARAAQEVADDAAKAKLPGTLKVGGKMLGGAGVALGIASDLDRGESVTQAVVSQGSSLLAGMATGAIIGSAIPIPVVGTVVGAVVGAGVAIAADGAVDSLFENGPDVGKARSSGLGALAETGSAISSFFGGGR